jgi:hypothetical protein
VSSSNTAKLTLAHSRANQGFEAAFSHFSRTRLSDLETRDTKPHANSNPLMAVVRFGKRASTNHCVADRRGSEQLASWLRRSTIVGRSLETSYVFVAFRMPQSSGVREVTRPRSEAGRDAIGRRFDGSSLDDTRTQVEPRCKRHP